MDAATVADLFVRDRRDDRTALVDATGKEFDYHWLCTTSWKAGNFLRHSGIREGVTVGVVGDGPLALFACFGTTLLGGTTRFDPPTDLANEDDVRALVAPVDELETDEYQLPAGAQRVGYGQKPESPGIHHFDAGLWSENPSFPPLSVDLDAAFLREDDRTIQHNDALAAARAVVDEYGLGADDRIVVREPLADARTVIAGVIAPLLVGGVVVLTNSADEGTETETDRGTYAVSSESVPEADRIPLETVTLS
ncbi:hypothetical protein ACLI4Z_14970 [Natrialbaceae archaeon A-arb3/5]